MANVMLSRPTYGNSKVTKVKLSSHGHNKRKIRSTPYPRPDQQQVDHIAAPSTSFTINLNDIEPEGFPMPISKVRQLSDDYDDEDSDTFEFSDDPTARSNSLKRTFSDLYDNYDYTLHELEMHKQNKIQEKQEKKQYLK